MKSNLKQKLIHFKCMLAEEAGKIGRNNLVEIIDLLLW